MYLTDSKMNFVTQFDEKFIPQGVALYDSLCRNFKTFKLFIVAIDDHTFNYLSQKSMPNVTVVRFKELEHPKLIKVRNNRNRKEYIWTATPFLPNYIFDEFIEIDHVTYIDADMVMLRDGSILIEKFLSSSKEIFLTRHDYAPIYDQSATSGEYCVQFMIFKRSAAATKFLNRWSDLCIEWCYDRVEPGRFGDQKYLEVLARQFHPNVLVNPVNGVFQAPWNASRFPFSDAIFFHFHGLRYLGKGNFLLDTGYMIPEPTVKNIYEPYVNDLMETIVDIESITKRPFEQVPISKRYKIPFFAFLQTIYRSRSLFRSSRIMKVR